MLTLVAPTIQVFLAKCFITEVFAGSWLHVPPARLHGNLPQATPLAPATPPKPAGPGAVGGGSPGGALGQAGGCQPVDERHRVSACSLEVSSLPPH